MFYLKNEIKTLHIEISTKCNASCPMCGRNNQGYGISPQLKVQNLSLSDIKRFLPSDFIHQLKRLIVCGNYGDPMMNPEIVGIFEYFKSVQPELKIELHTNGGVGSTETWKQLASLVHFSRFGIDGLEETNHLYRRGVRWSSLMNNINMFIQAGGAAEWAYLVFKHNEHQLTEAKTLSQSLGFKKFIPKRTTRYFTAEGEIVEKWPVMKSEGVLDYFLEAPDDEIFQKNQENFKNVKEAYNQNYQNYLSGATICCKVKAESSLFLAADGLLFPCCWLAIDYTSKGTRQGTTKGLLRQIEAHSHDLNFKNENIWNIISGNIFLEIEKSWSNTSRIRKCGQICGSGFDPFKSQF